MNLIDLVPTWLRPSPPMPDVEALVDLPLRREVATAAADARREALILSPGGGLIDSDDPEFRRLTTGTKFKRRDLSPMQQDRMLEIAWFLWETNPFARRLIQMMTDLVVGEGVGVEAKDPKILAATLRVWNHPINRLAERSRELHDALALNGELILPVGVNDVSGVPTIGFIEPYQVEGVELSVDNVLVPERLRLKKGPGDADHKRLEIIRPNPSTGLLEGEVFYFAINKLPNSGRGRSDYLPLADWLDLFDQFMFAEVERVRLLSTFVWDLEVKGATPEILRQRMAEIGTPKAGSVFGHNENEKLDAVAPELNASDRSETARLLTIHIAGSLGMPITWFGWPEGNRATIEGQADVALKTPAARQKQFGAFLNMIIRYGLERQRAANPVLFRGIENDTFGVTMPEIAPKDISRVGMVLAPVVAALDTAMQNRTMSRRVATMIQLALVKHLGTGLDFQASDVTDEADEDQGESQAADDEAQARRAARPGRPSNAPIPSDAAADDAA